MHGLVETLVTNTKAAIAWGAATIGSGLGLILGVVPDEIGKLATLVGVGVAMVAIRRGRAEARKLELEIEIMQRKEQERRRRAGRRSRLRVDDHANADREDAPGAIMPGSKPGPD